MLAFIHNHRARPALLIRILACVLLCAGALFATMLVAHAQGGNIEELKEDIELRNEKIEELEEEIARYQSQIGELSEEQETLESKIHSLELSEQKLRADIALAEEKMRLAEAKVNELTGKIEETESSIAVSTDALSESIRRMYQATDVSLVENLLRYESLSEVWSKLETLEIYQSSLSSRMEKLGELKIALGKQRAAERELKNRAAEIKEGLEVKAGLVVKNQQEQSQILSATESKEAEYQAMLEERLRRKEAFEAEIRELEAQIDVIVDPGAIPSSTPGVLSWPVRNVIVTQYFGNTPFATSNPQIYSGSGHNGIDLGAGIGTSIMSAADGTVTATGNTDLVCQGASYGRWVLIEHTNGLSTLYGHLSSINVSAGQKVARGQTIGYSGNSGYTTGPHLHFTVYATDGVQVRTMPSRACGTVYTLPLADRDAYLNPLSFL